AGNALVVLSTSDLTPLSGSPYSVAGAGEVTVTADVDGRFEDVYVLSGGGATLSVFRRTLAGNTISLAQTLADGSNGVRGLAGAAAHPDRQLLGHRGARPHYRQQ